MIKFQAVFRDTRGHPRYFTYDAHDIEDAGRMARLIQSQILKADFVLTGYFPESTHA